MFSVNLKLTNEITAFNSNSPNGPLKTMEEVGDFLANAPANGTFSKNHRRGRKMATALRRSNHVYSGQLKKTLECKIL